MCWSPRVVGSQVPIISSMSYPSLPRASQACHPLTLCYPRPVPLSSSQRRQPASLRARLSVRDRGPRRREGAPEESNRVELKATWDTHTKAAIVRTVCAFAGESFPTAIGAP